MKSIDITGGIASVFYKSVCLFLSFFSAIAISPVLLLAQEAPLAGHIPVSQITKAGISSEKNFMYYYALGKSNFKKGNLEEALAQFKKVLNWDPNFQPALQHIKLIENKIAKNKLIEEKKRLAEENMP